MLILNCRGYYKYVMGKQLSEREADRRECMLFPNLYKWVCICSSLLIAVVLFYYYIEGLTANSFRLLLVTGISFGISQILQIAQRKESKYYKNSLVVIVYLSLIILLFIYMFFN